jgi:uncharacterized protein YjbI with pentapeptide repeats
LAALGIAVIVTFRETIIQQLPFGSEKFLLAIVGTVVTLLGAVIKMNSRTAQNKNADYLRPISWRWVAAGVFVAAISAWAVTSWLLSIAGDDPGRKLDAIKTGLTVGAGAGGIIALLVATRRQWLQERTHIHDREIARATQYDATERRVTELYAKAAEQLGSEKAAVRLAGLYSLERLAQNHEEYRQTIVSVLCAYLRMKITDDASAASSSLSEQEQQVRLTAQDILTRHLHYDQEAESSEFWPGMSLVLDGAHLISFRLDGAKIDSASFADCIFQGGGRFFGTAFEGPATFRGAVFSGVTSFSECVFGGTARFSEARFQEAVAFRRATFKEQAVFVAVEFGQSVTFASSRFDNLAKFTSVKFVDSARFSGSTFGGIADFEDACFEAEAIFSATEFYKLANYRRCKFLASSKFRGATFHGRTTFKRVQFDLRATYEGCTFANVALFGGSVFAGRADFRKITFLDLASFSGVEFKFAARFEGSYFDRANFASAVFFGRAGFGESTFAGEGQFRNVQFLGLIKFNGDAQSADVDFAGSFSEGANIGECILPFGWQIADDGSRRSFVHLSSVQP